MRIRLELADKRRIESGMNWKLELLHLHQEVGDGEWPSRQLPLFVLTVRTYQLEIIQQPQRARACGFGDKVSINLAVSGLD